jgi:hypothetical protein
MSKEPQDWNFFLEANETPFTQVLRSGKIKMKPDFCKKTVRRHLDPEFSVWKGLEEILQSLAPGHDEQDWWEPSERYLELQRLAQTLEPATYIEVPNPGYDEGACQQWKDDNPVKKMVWGQSVWPEGSISDDMRERLRRETNRQARLLECQMMHGKDAPECESLRREENND